MGEIGAVLILLAIFLVFTYWEFFVSVFLLILVVGVLASIAAKIEAAEKERQRQVAIEHEARKAAERERLHQERIEKDKLAEELRVHCNKGEWLLAIQKASATRYSAFAREKIAAYRTRMEEKVRADIVGYRFGDALALLTAMEKVFKTLPEWQGAIKALQNVLTMQETKRSILFVDDTVNMPLLRALRNAHNPPRCKPSVSESLEHTLWQYVLQPNFDSLAFASVWAAARKLAKPNQALPVDVALPLLYVKYRYSDAVATSICPDAAAVLDTYYHRADTAMRRDWNAVISLARSEKSAAPTKQPA